MPTYLGTLNVNPNGEQQPNDATFNNVPVFTQAMPLIQSVSNMRIILTVNNVNLAVDLSNFALGNFNAATATVHVTRVDSSDGWNVQIPIAVQVTYNEGLNDPPEPIA
jgi:hypothetical protein